jgi:DNA-binding transcriptional LysR family regulator
MKQASGDIDWNLLRSFLAVVEAGSLTRAAEQLSISQPTLSRQIAALEAAVGAPLFERTARRLRPTVAGQTLTEPALRMRAAVQAASSALTRRGEELAGSVRLTASEVVSAFVLPEVLTRLARRYPEIEVELVASNEVDNLLEREADIAVRMVRPSQQSLITKHVGDWPLGVYAHPDYLASVGGSVDAARLDRCRWIGEDRSTQLIDGFAAAGFAVDRGFFGLRCDNQIVTLQALRAGLGLGVAFVPLAERWGLARVLPEVPVPGLPVWLTAHRELRASRRLRTVFALLAEGLREWAESA